MAFFYISPKGFLQLKFFDQLGKQNKTKPKQNKKKFLWSHSCPSLLTGVELHRYECKLVFASMFHHVVGLKRFKNICSSRSNLKCNSVRSSMLTRTLTRCLRWFPGTSLDSQPSLLQCLSPPQYEHCYEECLLGCSGLLRHGHRLVGCGGLLELYWLAHAKTITRNITKFRLSCTFADFHAK